MLFEGKIRSSDDDDGDDPGGGHDLHFHGEYYDDMDRRLVIEPAPAEELSYFALARINAFWLGYHVQI